MLILGGLISSGIDAEVALILNGADFGWRSASALR